LQSADEEGGFKSQGSRGDSQEEVLVRTAETTLNPLKNHLLLQKYIGNEILKGNEK